jgi:hypothetical protein
MKVFDSMNVLSLLCACFFLPFVSIKANILDELDDVLTELNPLVSLRACDEPTTTDVLNLITDEPLELQNRLPSDAYLFTYPTNQRSLLDMPQFLLHEFCRSEDWQVYAALFYNQTTRVYYTDEGDTIDSYFNLNQENLIRGIDEVVQAFLNLPSALTVFGGMRIQERRAGLMFDLYKAWGPYNVEWRTPVYYFERNFYLDPTEEELLKNSIYLDDNDSGTTDEEEINKHFFSDQFGLGDSRLLLGKYVLDAPEHQANVGGGLTLPTAIAYVKGLWGSNFGKNDWYPPFNIFQIAQLALCEPPSGRDLPQVEQITTDFLTTTIDKLSANLLQRSLGNNGHFGLLIFGEYYMQLSERARVSTRAEIEYQLPAFERRFYITKKDPAAFIALEPYQDNPPDVAAVKLAFLNEQLINTLIPKVYSTRIFPGVLFKFTSALDGSLNERWRLGGGLDVWLQGKESLGTIRATVQEIYAVRLDIAKKPMAYQSKLFGSFNYSRPGGRWFDLCLQFYGDYSFLSSGIGKDFNATVKASFIF